MPRREGAGTRGWALVSSLAVAALAGVLTAKLAPQAGRARLFGDECFHAYLAEWIRGHGRLPDRLPELYGGLWYSYPPLLHALGAVWLKLFGAASLVELNVVLFAALLGALAFLPVAGLAGAPRRWAALLCICNGWLAIYAVRFFAEMLVSFLGLVFILLVLRHWRSERHRDAVSLGAVTGLALLAKQTALALPLLLALLAAVALALRRPARARGLLLALGIGVVMALPMFVRNAALYGSPIYPALAPDVDRDLLRLYQAQSGYTPAHYLGECYRACGPSLLALAIAALAVAALRRRGDIVVVLVALCPVGAALNYLSPLHDARHVLPLIPVMALLASIVLADEARRWPRAGVALEAALLVLAAITVTRMEEFRHRYDPYAFLAQAYRAAPQVVPEGATILSLYTYDTWYYTRRRATWPLAWGPVSRLADLLRTRDPEQLLELAREHHIDYLLAPRWLGSDEFFGSNYTRGFSECVAELIRQGRMRAVWMGPSIAIVAVNP